MVKKCVVSSLILLQAIFSSGQNLQLIDSLKNELIHTDGKKRFDLLCDLSWEYRWANPDSTIYYADSAYNLGQTLNLPKELAKPVNFIGVGNNYKGNRLAAFDNYDKAIRISQDQNDSAQIAHSNNNIGRLFFEQGLLTRSYKHFVKALFIFSKIKDSSGLAYTFQSLANLYSSQKDFSKAEYNYLNALKIRMSLGNTRDIMSALVQTGVLYQENGRHDKALRYFHLADSAGHVINDAINLAEIKTIAAESFLEQGMLFEAEAMCNDGLNYILIKKNTRLLPQAYITMGQIQIKKKNLVRAKFYFEKSLAISSQLKDRAARMDSYYFLWKLSKGEKNRHAELHNYNQYLILKDSIKDLDLTRQVERMHFQIDIQRKEQENELLKTKALISSALIKQQKIQNFSLIGLVGLISVFGFIQWLSSKKRKGVNEKLIFQNEEIQKQREEIVSQNDRLSKHNQQLSDINEEKETLMSIVVHDLKSPLNRILGIANIMKLEGLKEDQEVTVKIINEAAQAGLGLITDLLDVHMLEENTIPSYSTFDLRVFLFDKMKEFFPAAESKNIHLKIKRVESEEVVTDMDYLDRILDNLLSNAIKFSERHSTVDVSAYKLNGCIWIAIKDYGPGFSDLDKSQLFQKFKKLSARPTGGETSNGLGLAIVKILVDRLKGEIHLISEAGDGSEFIVKLPQYLDNFKGD